MSQFEETPSVPGARLPGLPRLGNVLAACKTLGIYSKGSGSSRSTLFIAAKMEGIIQMITGAADPRALDGQLRSREEALRQVTRDEAAVVLACERLDHARHALGLLHVLAARGRGARRPGPRPPRRGSLGGALLRATAAGRRARAGPRLR